MWNRIAFAGRMQVGKTTAAEHLVACHGFVKYALADPIKRIAAADFGWDGAKDARGRRLLQELGTVGRNYDSGLWLERFAARLAEEAPPRAVVDDVRLAREVAFLEALGFICVRITRPAERSHHHTETELDGIAFVHTIDNRGSLADLYARVDGLSENRKAPPHGEAFGD